MVAQKGFQVDKGGHHKDKPNKYNASCGEMNLQFVAKNYVVVVSSLASLASDENRLHKHAMSNHSECRPRAISHEDKLKFIDYFNVLWLSHNPTRNRAQRA